MDKAEWRKEFMRRRNSLPAAMKRRAARLIAAYLLHLPEMREAKTIGLYASFRGEVPTARIALMLSAAGKSIALPVIADRGRDMTFRRVGHWHQLCPGPYGLRQPGPACPVIDPKELDLVLVPGLGFDSLGYRLGYGAGYYDRYLPLLRPGCATAGLAFACQVVPLLPHGEYDFPVEMLVTEKGVRRILAAEMKSQ